MAERIEAALAEFANDKSFRLGNYGYTVQKARGKGAGGFAAKKNEKP